MPLAAHKRDLAERGGRPAAVIRVGFAPEPPEDIAPGRPGRRIAAEQVNAKRGEVVRHVAYQLAGRRRVVPLLVHHDFQRAAQERQAPRQRLIEHDSHAVPVAGLRDIQARRLLGRHVRGRTRHVRLGGLGQPPSAQLRRQAEVEEYDPTDRRHQHIRRLDVAVQLTRVVNRRDPPCKLEERVTERFRPDDERCFGTADPGQSGAERIEASLR